MGKIRALSFLALSVGKRWMVDGSPHDRVGSCDNFVAFYVRVGLLAPPLISS